PVPYTTLFRSSTVVFRRGTQRVALVDPEPGCAVSAGRLDHRFGDGGPGPAVTVDVGGAVAGRHDQDPHPTGGQCPVEGRADVAGPLDPFGRYPVGLRH